MTAQNLIFKHPRIVDTEIKYLQVDANFRYVGYDADADIKPDLCGLNDSNWKVLIDVISGIILNWKGTEYITRVFGKVADDGIYTLLTNNKNKVVCLEHSYVPYCINGGDPDYVDLIIKADGTIENWKPNFKDFREALLRIYRSEYVSSIWDSHDPAKWSVIDSVSPIIKI